MKRLCKLILIFIFAISISNVLHSHDIVGWYNLSEDTKNLFMPYISESNIYSSVYNYGHRIIIQKSQEQGSTLSDKTPAEIENTTCKINYRDVRSEHALTSDILIEENQNFNIYYVLLNDTDDVKFKDDMLIFITDKNNNVLYDVLSYRHPIFGVSKSVLAIKKIDNNNFILVLFNGITSYVEYMHTGSDITIVEQYNQSSGPGKSGIANSGKKAIDASDVDRGEANAPNLNIDEINIFQR